MSEVALKLAEAVELLDNSKALKRESGAKRLRKLGLAESGEALFNALQKEVKDKRTWSTQYHLIIALGVVKHASALPFLWELAHRDFDATILYMALGDSILRLSLLEKPLEDAWNEILQTQNAKLIYGALRAIALLKLVPNDSIVQDIIGVARKPEFVDGVRGYPGDQSGLRYWVAIASAGWKPSLVHDFLLESHRINDTSLKYAAENALKGKYVRWDY
jgi:hypothetical protein